jgi:hypothetical protein
VGVTGALGGAHETMIKTMSKTVTMFLIFMDALFCNELPGNSL